MSNPTSQAEGRARVKPFAVGVMSVAIGALVLLRIVSADGVDITALLAFGEDAVEITEHAESVLGSEVFLRATQGHDGKFFFLQALDPLYLSPDVHASLLDRPVYRGQRMLYPLLAGAGGLTPAHAVPWSMVIVNLVALGVGAWGTARYAVRMGAHPLWGLAFPLNVGLVSEFAISGSGVVGFAAAVWAFDAMERERVGVATALLTLSVLSREAMLLTVLGVLVAARIRSGHWRWRLAVTPALAASVWAVYLRLRLHEGSGVDEVQELGPPFLGMIRTLPDWFADPLDFAIAAVTIAVLVLVVLRTVGSESYYAWGTVGFAVLAVFLTRQVWLQYWDITRAVAPALTGFVVISFVDRSRRSAPLDRGGER